MNKRGAGIALIGISALLVSVRSLNGTAYTVGRTLVASEQFDNQIAILPTKNFAVVTGIAGIAYLIWAEVEEIIAARKEQARIP